MWKLFPAARKRHLFLLQEKPRAWESDSESASEAGEPSPPISSSAASPESCCCEALPQLPPVPGVSGGAAEEKSDEGREGTAGCIRHVRLQHFESAWWTLMAAPLVKASDLPFRLFCRKYGSRVCYSQMLYSSEVLRNPNYVQQMLRSSARDRPLVIQLAGNDPEIFLRAAQLLQGVCDAIDLNLGCPQREARRDVFGSFLLSDPQHHDRVLEMVRRAVGKLRIPVFAKIRLLERQEETLGFCRRLEKAGIALLVVHARKQGDVRQRRAGPPDLRQVRAIQKTLRIPVITNGGIRSWEDIRAHLRSTGAAGVMSGEGLLGNPSLFAPSLLFSQEHQETKARVVSSSSPDGEADCHLCGQEEAFLEWVEKGSPKLISGGGESGDDAWEAILYSEDFPPPAVSESSAEEERERREVMDERIVIPSRLRPKFLNRLGLALEYLEWVETVEPGLPLFLVRFHLKHIADEPLWRTRLKDEILEGRSLQELKDCLVRCWRIVAFWKPRPLRKRRRISGDGCGGSGPVEAEDPKEKQKQLSIIHRRRKALEEEEKKESGWIRPSGLARFCPVHKIWREPPDAPH